MKDDVIKCAWIDVSVEYRREANESKYEINRKISSRVATGRFCISLCIFIDLSSS